MVESRKLINLSTRKGVFSNRRGNRWCSIMGESFGVVSWGNCCCSIIHLIQPRGRKTFHRITTTYFTFEQEFQTNQLFHVFFFQKIAYWFVVCMSMNVFHQKTHSFCFIWKEFSELHLIPPKNMYALHTKLMEIQSFAWCSKNSISLYGC